MEWKENFGMEYGRCSEWNGMEDLKNGTEDRLSYFHTNYIYSMYQNLQQTTKYYQTKMRIISHFSVLQCKFLACCDCIVLFRIINTSLRLCKSIFRGKGIVSFWTLPCRKKNNTNGAMYLKYAKLFRWFL